MCFVRGNLHSDDNGCNTFNVRAHNQLTDDSTLTTGWYCSCCRHRCHRRLCFCRGDEYNLFGRNFRRRRGITWIITRLFDRTRSRALSRSLSLMHTHPHRTRWNVTFHVATIWSNNNETSYTKRQRHLSMLRVPRNHYPEKKNHFYGISNLSTLTRLQPRRNGTKNARG